MRSPKNELWKPGQSGNPNGKPKGTLNRTTLALKEAILLAAEKAGDSLNETGSVPTRGLVGYLQHLAVEEPSSFAPLLGRVLPHTIAGDADNPLQAITRIECVLVEPRAVDMSPKAIEGEKA